MLHILLSAASLCTSPNPPFDPIAGMQGCLARAGDLNRDGVDDLWVAGRMDDAFSLQSPEEPAGVDLTGHIWALSGRDGTVLLHFEATKNRHRYATSLASAGDLTGDGVPDLVVGGGHDFIRGGWIELRSGADGAIIHHVGGPKRGEKFGFSVAGGHDLDGDGMPDVVVGAPLRLPYQGNSSPSTREDTELGSTYLISGATGKLIQIGPDAESTRTSAFPRGGCVAIAPDMDGDGTPEVMVGPTIYSVQSGKILSELALGNWKVGILGDVNEDGIDDFFSTEANLYARITSGADGTTLRRLEGKRSMSYNAFGLSADVLGDVDGDGAPDLAVGANKSPAMDREPNRGLARVYSGRTGEILFNRIAAEHDGIDVAGIGDVNGDKQPDLAICHRKTQRVEVYSSANWEPLWSVEIASLVE